MQKYILTILLFLPLLLQAQLTREYLTREQRTQIISIGEPVINPSDSLKKYQKLYTRDQDSLKKYTKKAGWNVHYFKLCEKRKEQIHHWSEEIYLMDRQKRGSKS